MSVAPPLPRERLHGLLAGFAGRRVLVVGDCMLDEYVWGRAERISPEAPVMVVEQTDRTYAAGGASNVAVNLAALGGAAALVAVVGADEMGERLRGELEARGVRADLVLDSERPTTLKTRILAHNQQVLRVDREHRAPLGAEAARRLSERALAALADAEAVLLSDYNKGVLAPAVVGELLGAAHSQGKPVFVNPKPAGLAGFRGATLIQLNQAEAEAAAGASLAEASAFQPAGERLLELCGAEAVVVTLGGRGLLLFRPGETWRHLEVAPLEVYDPCGCGDSAIAAATLARLAGGDWVEAASLANLAGNAKVRKRGVVPVTRGEIEHVWAATARLRNGGAAA